MDKVTAFLAKYNITTHSVAAAIGTLTLLYASVPAFHDLVVKGFQATPSWVHEVVTAIIGIYAFYHKSSSGQATPPSN